MHLSFTDDAGRCQESSRKDPKYLYASDATPHAKSKFTNLIAVSVVQCWDIFTLIFGFVNFAPFKENRMYTSHSILMLKVLLDNVETHLKSHQYSFHAQVNGKAVIIIYASLSYKLKTRVNNVFLRLN